VQQQARIISWNKVKVKFIPSLSDKPLGLAEQGTWRQVFTYSNDPFWMDVGLLFFQGEAPPPSFILKFFSVFLIN
jgi:hypothetical protein